MPGEIPLTEWRLLELNNNTARPRTRPRSAPLKLRKSRAVG